VSILAAAVSSALAALAAAARCARCRHVGGAPRRRQPPHGRCARPRPRSPRGGGLRGGEEGAVVSRNVRAFTLSVALGASLGVAAYCAAGREPLGCALASCAAVACVVALRSLRGAP